MKANELLAKVEEDHNFTHTPINVNTTDGIHKALALHWAAIKAFADKIDSIDKDKPVVAAPENPNDPYVPLTDRSGDRIGDHRYDAQPNTQPNAQF